MIKIRWVTRYRLTKSLKKTIKQLKPHREIVYHIGNMLPLIDKHYPEYAKYLRILLTDIGKTVLDIEKRKKKIESLLNVKQQAE